ncbi:MAG: hypothetical protein RMJ86_01540 [Anaerolineae bacterium]|nr:hypothetical protein [Thermoflexales bacterium]MCX7939087.1 hypothetical protein [Thermoflexales bacterium]MDW8053217.1 hypothetical protein [Anaerolineae bacterium]
MERPTTSAPQMPPGVTVEQTAAGVRVTHRVFSASAMSFSVIFIAVFVAMVIANIVASAQGMPSFSVCVMVPSAALAMLGSVGVYQSMLGRFVIEITPEQLRVRALHVPLAPRLRVADPREIVAIHCTYARVGKNYFDLRARLRGGRSVPLIEAIHSREAALFLRRTLARALHVHEEHALDQRIEEVS